MLSIQLESKKGKINKMIYSLIKTGNRMCVHGGGG